MPLLKPRKWEILVRPYLKVQVGTEEIKTFPTSATKFGVLDPFWNAPPRASDKPQHPILPLKTPVKQPQIWEQYTEDNNPIFTFPMKGDGNSYVELKITLNAPYNANEIQLFSVIEKNGTKTKGNRISEEYFTIKTTSTQTIIEGKASETGVGGTAPKPSPTDYGTEIMIDALKQPPNIEAMVSYFITTSYDQALKVFYQLVSEIGQDNVELKEVIPIDIVVRPKH